VVELALLNVFLLKLKEIVGLLDPGQFESDKFEVGVFFV
jgi:hypothetical protein